MFAFILLGLSQNLRGSPSLNITIFIAHFSRVAEVGAKVERAAVGAFVSGQGGPWLL
jgi:hypothetical protein